MSMDRAAPLMAFIRKTETGFDDARAYDTMYAHKKITPPLTQMSLGQAIKAGPSWTKAHKSSAAGAYQFMNATLKDLRNSLSLGDDLRLNQQAQDRLGYALLKRRGFEDFLAGRMTLAAFGKALAQEWASFPVLVDTKGAHQQIKRGQSYYAGDALNKALVKPEQVEAILAQVMGKHPAAPKPAPLPIDLPDDVAPEPAFNGGPTWQGWALLAALAIVAYLVFQFVL